MANTTEARQVVIDLFHKHGITDVAQAKRLARDRFSQQDWDAYTAAIKLLDAMGDLN